MIYKRDDSPYWWVKISINGNSVCRSTKTTKKREAQEVHDHLSHELWRQGQGLPKIRKWQEATTKYLQQKRDSKSQPDMARHLAFWDKHLSHLQLQHITTETISDIDLPFDAATANRYRSTLKSLLNTAHKQWGWLNTVPVITLQKEIKQRIRWITRTEADRLIAAMPDYLQAAAEFSLQTGLRQSNVFDLRWGQVDMLRKTAWVYGDQAKGKKDISIPLNTVALNILYGRANRHPTHVFCNRKGKPITSIDSRMWGRILKKAEIENFRWHDLRHTWASWHVQNGTTLQELMELGGWASLDIVLRYAHLSSKQLATTVENITSRPSVQSDQSPADPDGFQVDRFHPRYPPVE